MKYYGKNALIPGTQTLNLEITMIPSSLHAPSSIRISTKLFRFSFSPDPPTERVLEGGPSYRKTEVQRAEELEKSQRRDISG